MIDNKTPFVYISGWMGSGKGSSSYKWLERHFKNLECYAAGGRTDVGKMVKDLSEIIHDCLRKYGQEPILIGNSYGGFLASQFPEAQVLINPALFPSESLPRITDLTEEEIKRFKEWEEMRSVDNRHRARRDTFCLCTEGDEVIPDHRTEVVSTHAPVMIPGGKHRLTDEQRDQYLLPMLKRLAAVEYRIVKFSIDNPKTLLSGETCKAVKRTFAKVFTSFEEAQHHLSRYIKEQSRTDEKRTVIGYKIEERIGYDKKEAETEWSFVPDGRMLAESSTNCSQKFYGREFKDMPFRKGDYVLTPGWHGMSLGLVFAEPRTPDEVKRMMNRDALKDTPLDSSDDCYLVDYIGEKHDHPFASDLFPIPFDESAIPYEVKKALHWADSQNIKN